LSRNLILATIAMASMAAMTPSFAADPEVEALKAELAAQRKLIDQLLVNQGQARGQASPSEASDVQQRLDSQQKGPINAPIAATGAAAPPVRFYGVADVAVTSMNSGYGNKVRVDGGGGFSASRLGVQVTKNIGSVKVTALAEGGVQFSTGSTGAATPALGVNASTPSSGGAPGTGSQVFSRQMWAGLDAGIGMVSIGRQYTGSYLAQATVGAAHGDGLYGDVVTFASIVGGMPTRQNNSIVWSTPRVADFRGILMYFAGSENNVSGTTAVGTTSTNDKAGRGLDVAGIYSAHGVEATITGWDYNGASWVTAGETGLAKRKGYQLGANYDFGAFRLFGDFVHGTISGGNYQNVTKALSDSNGYSASVLVPFGPHKLMATWTRVDDKSLLNRDASLLGVAYWYELASDTTLYTSLGRMVNNGNASYALNDGANLVGSVARPGFNATGFEAGLNYKF
jgi:hypothetical protein